MPPKQTKTRADLTALYMREFLLRYDALPPGVVDIAIRAKPRAAPHLPNWSAVALGPAGAVRVMSVRLVEADLQVRYDLDPSDAEPVDSV